MKRLELDRVCEPEKYELFNFLTENGAITLLDFIFLQKLFEDYQMYYVMDEDTGHMQARKFKSSTDEGERYFYLTSFRYWFNENRIYGLFVSESEIISRLYYYVDLGIIDLVKQNRFYYLRFTDRAYPLFSSYLDSLEA